MESGGLLLNLPSAKPASTPTDPRWSASSTSTSPPKSQPLTRTLAPNPATSTVQQPQQQKAPSSAGGATTNCDVCDKPWVPDRTDPTEVFYPDEEQVLPYKCPACCKKSYGGVSYVVRSESRQGETTDIKSLPHIVYQPKNLRCEPSQFLTRCFHEVIRKGDAYVAILSGENADQNDAREYLMWPERRKNFLQPNNYELIKGLENLQDKLLDKRMLILHYKYHEEFVLLPSLVKTGEREDSYDSLKSIEESDIQIGMVVRKGTNKDHGPSLNVRLDLFVTGKPLWDRLSTKRRNELKYIQQLVEDRLLVFFKQWNQLGKPKSDIPSPTSFPATSPSSTATATPSSPATPATTSPSKKPSSSSLPLFLVSFRDIFKIELIPVTTEVTFPAPTVGYGAHHLISRQCLKTVWYFPRDNLPNNYVPSVTSNANLPGEPVGVVQYNGFFSQEELAVIEKEADSTDEGAKTGCYDNLPLTHQASKKGARICRTKYFFSARYLWTKEQMDDPDASRAEGIRADVAGPPGWMKKMVERPMVQAGIIADGWVNEYAMNIYHDGTEGLGQHYDDKKRFQRPILSLRVFSDCRLAFGSKDFAMVNSLFFVPMPRGCITILEKDGYAADGIKHCIRPSDMAGKSGVVLLRQIHPHVMEDAKRMYHEQWVSRWLESIVGLENPKQYVAGFIEEDINFPALCTLNECDLRALGFTKMGPRKLVMNSIETLKEKLTGKPTHPHMPCCCNCVSHREGCKYEKENAAMEGQSSRALDHPPHQPSLPQLQAKSMILSPAATRISLNGNNRGNGFSHGHHSSSQSDQIMCDAKFVAEEVLEQGTTPHYVSHFASSMMTDSTTVDAAGTVAASPAKPRGRSRGLSNSSGNASSNASVNGNATTTPPGHKRRAETSLTNRQTAKKPTPSPAAAQQAPSSTSSLPYSPFSTTNTISSVSPASSLFGLPSVPQSPSAPSSPPPPVSSPFTPVRQQAGTPPSGSPPATPTAVTTPSTTNGAVPSSADAGSATSPAPSFLYASDAWRTPQRNPSTPPQSKGDDNWGAQPFAKRFQAAPNQQQSASNPPRQPLAPLFTNTNVQ